MSKRDPVKHTRTLHQQLFEHFRDQMAEGALTPGTQLPPETVIGATFGVSRGTVRQALKALTEAHLIERAPGRGTFVKDSPALPGASRPAAGEGRHIGAILPYGDGHEVFFTDIMRGVRAACLSRDYGVGFGYSHESGAQERYEVERLVQAGCAGLVVFAHTPETTVPLLEQLPTPFVLVDRRHRDIETDFVGVDNVGGAYRATEHLILLGHRRVAFVHYNAGVDTLSVSSVWERWQGYRKALSDYRVPFVKEWFYGGTPGSEDEARAYLSFFRQREQPTAAFVVNDRTAILFVRAAKLAGCAIPDDLALVSFDDLPIVSQLSVALTSVRQPRYDLGFRAAHLLIDRAEGKLRLSSQVILPTELKIRESCGARRAVGLVPGEAA